MKGLFVRYLYVQYQHPIPHGSKDIAQVKVSSLRFDDNTDTEVITKALRTVIPTS
jgi:hypothetical protein